MGSETKEFHGHKKKVRIYDRVLQLLVLFLVERGSHQVITQVHSVAWNMDGKKLASGSVDKTARVWTVAEHKHVRETPHELQPCTHKPRDARRKLTCISDFFPRCMQGREMELKGHTDAVDQVCWNPTHPDQLATACGDKTVKLWDVRSGDENFRIFILTVSQSSGGHLLTPDFRRQL